MRTTSMLWIASAATIACVGAAPTLAADPTGNWLTPNGRATIRIATCGDALCGTIVALKEPNDPQTGRPKTDKNNADASKRGRPLIGVPIVMGMRPSGPNTWSGQVYNAEDGKTYSGRATLTDPRTLKLEGCAAAVFCRSQTWTRAN